MTIGSGRIALLGSGEFDPWSDDLDHELLAGATGDGSVLIVPTASAREGDTFNGWAAKGLEHYARLGVPARVVRLRDREDAFRRDLARDLSTVSLVFLSGGNPEFLARTFAESPFWKGVIEALDRGAAIAGCSAGACVLGEFAPKSVSERIEETAWHKGMRVLPNVWVLPHWDAISPEVRDHFLSRLPADALVMGIDENTAAFGDGEAFGVFGKGGVTIIKAGTERVFFQSERFSLREATEVKQPLDARVARVVDEIPEGFGAVGLLSGDEFTPPVEEFDRAMLGAAGPRVAILLCADPETAPVQASRARAHYERLGAEPIVLDVLERIDADARSLPDYDVLFVGGGSPSTLVETLRGTSLWQEVLRRWSTGASLAGSSAGAMALCRYLTVPEPGADMPTRWIEGIGVLSKFGLAVHAASRPPEWLQQIARDAPVPVVAVDDACGLVLAPDAAPRWIGEGSGWVVEKTA